MIKHVTAILGNKLAWVLTLDMAMRIAFIIFIASMVGCAAPIKEKVYVDKYVYVKPTASMLKDCKATAPPDKIEYLGSTYQGKEQLLYEYANALITDISVCNVQWDELRKWNVEQEKVYSTAKTK